MPHICMDEVLMFLAVFPFIGFYFKKVHLWYHTKFHHKPHTHKDEGSCSNQDHFHPKE